MTIVTSRRSLLTGLAATLITAPSIVRAGSLMPVKVMTPSTIRYYLYGLVRAQSLAGVGVVRKTSFIDVPSEIANIPTVRMRYLTDYVEIAGDSFNKVTWYSEEDFRTIKEQDR